MGRLGWGCIALSLCVACSSSESSPTEPPRNVEAPPAPPAPRQQNPLHVALQAELDGFDAGSPGTILLAHSPELGTFLGAAGWSSLDETPMERTMTFGVASITKSFTAAVVLELWEEGALSLDDTVSEVCATCPFGHYTIDDLLLHRTGLSDAVWKVVNDSDLDTWRVWTPEELMAEVVDGTPLPYSNSNYLLLGMVVESVTGARWEDEVRGRLLTPLGLTRTFLPTVEEAPDMARGHYVNGADVLDLYDPSVGWSAGSMVADAMDVLAWFRMLFDGDAVSPAVLAKMVEVQGLYGRGLFERDELVGHDGVGLHLTQAFCEPDGARCVVAMANQIDADAEGVMALGWQAIEAAR